MEFRTGSIDFSAPMRGSGPRTVSQTIVFPRQVTNAVAGLNGYTVGYSGDDHHVGQMDIRIMASVNANTVTVQAWLGLRDWSGTWDDNYQGTIDFTILAELEPANAVPPRLDLVVTDIEFNQAVQFFRANTYLDPANVQPDNSIWLVARKNTGLRVYTDWDASAGLPTINQLTGKVTVMTSSTTLNLSPINPGGSIAPIRDAQINMALSGHTLNFMIPAAWCVGTVTVSCEIWDVASPGQKSAKFTRTIVFTPVKPLNLYLVGINYQAVMPNIPAPTQSAISGALARLIKTYPVGDVFQTGYMTLNFSESVVANLANGCGTGFNDLLDRLDDLRGSADDIYLGILPAGIVNTPGNSVGGCAPQGGKTAATFLDTTADFPHEIGHALDRHHAPCASGCGIAPADPDPNYPQYGSFRSDSIGVFGFDPTTNFVFSPAAFSDFMAYFSPQWVSAYTYNGLRGSYFGPAGGGSSPGPGAHLRDDTDINVIFLGLTITRDRQVTRRPSFNFPAKLLNRKRCGDFIAEFQDEKRQPLSCSPLHCNCEAGCKCWPKNIRDVIPFPENSRWLVIWEDNKMIYEEEIPPAPKIEMVSAEPQEEGVMLSWRAQENEPDLVYLVHWYDERKGGQWRGVAPRQNENKLLIPGRLFSYGKALKVRVLGTAGLGTGIAEHTIQHRGGSPEILKGILVNADLSKGMPVEIPDVLLASIFDNAGAEPPGYTAKWYANNALLGAGNSVDLRSLPYGKHELRYVARGAGYVKSKSWMLSRDYKGFQIHNEGCDPLPGKTKPPHQHPHPHPPDPCSD